jgi:hypothetical protein
MVGSWQAMQKSASKELWTTKGFDGTDSSRPTFWSVCRLSRHVVGEIRKNPSWRLSRIAEVTCLSSRISLCPEPL